MNDKEVDLNQSRIFIEYDNATYVEIYCYLNNTCV